MLSHRIISAIIFFALFFSGLFVPKMGWALPIMLAFAAISSLWEFVHFGQLKPRRTFWHLSIVASLAMLADGYYTRLDHTPLILGFLTIVAMGYGTLKLDKNFAESAGKCVMGVVYTTLPLAIIMTIWQQCVKSDALNGQHYLIFLVLITQASDVGAFFAGRAFGKHKLAPNLSPGKTVEGFIGGVLFTVVLAVVFMLYWNNMDRIFNWTEAIFLAVAFSTLGPLGDLAESWLKRNAGVKDSGHIILGHGGMLDVIDSLLFTTPFYYAFLKIFHPDVLS